jgi:hypothetical protein
MKTLRKSVLATLVALTVGMSGVALAQGPGPGKGGCDPAVGAMGMPGGGGMHGANMDARLAQIKSELKITAQQEGAWQVFETAVKTQRAQTRGPVSAQTAPERADAHVARLEQRLAGAKEIAQAVKDLYGRLTPEQKASADRILMQGGRRAG